MDEKSAIKLVEKTFGDEFNEDRYLEFIIELFGDSSFLKSPKKYTIWDDYNKYADSLKYYGTYKDSSNKAIDILSVRLKKSRYVNKLRTVQRNIIVKWLNDTNRDSALVAFYGDKSEDWRFSLIKMDYEITEDFKIEKNFTPAKRSSFLIGKNGANYTCKKNFLTFIVNEENPTLEEIENAFNFEKIIESLWEYRNLFSNYEVHIDESQIRDLKHILLDYGRLPLDSSQKNILDMIIYHIEKYIKYRFSINVEINGTEYLTNYGNFKKYMSLFKQQFGNSRFSDKEMVLCIIKHLKCVKDGIIYINTPEEVANYFKQTMGEHQKVKPPSKKKKVNGDATAKKNNKLNKKEPQKVKSSPEENNKLNVKILNKVGKLSNLSINNELIIKKVISHKIKHDKLIVYVENNKKPLKLTIMRKGDTYNITGATRKELENKFIGIYYN